MIGKTPRLLQLFRASPIIGLATLRAKTFRYWNSDKAGELSYRDDVTFDPDGPGSLENLAWHPQHYSTAERIGKEAIHVTQTVYRGQKVGKEKANAFLHAYLSYRLTEELGPKTAKRFTDANEVKPPRLYENVVTPWKKALEDKRVTYEKTLKPSWNALKKLPFSYDNPKKEMRSDLWNNGFGRRLYAEGLAKNAQEAIRIIKQAIENGHLSVIDNL